ncbi:MAG: bidirectional hydrogenase complex protein HoxU [Chloroflexota bacterium]
MSRVVTLKINDQDYSGRDDETLLELAQENGIFIPTLCHLEGLSDVGACRLCLIEIKGTPKLMPACVVHAQEGMEVYTESERLKKYRQMVIEMLFTEGNHICSVCVSNGHCELQYLAQKLGVDHMRLEYRSPKRAVDASHPRFVLDTNRCILCTRCVRVCDEVEGAHTWDVMGRGIQAKVITDLNQPWGDATSCTGCSKCVNVCPTGALFDKGKSVAEMSKRGDFLPYLTAMREKRK